MFIVYKESPDGEYKVIETNALASEIRKKIPFNWYGSDAATPEAAIQQAIDDGFEYRSPEEMASLNQRLRNVQAQAAEFFLESSRSHLDWE